ncbi:hypothetical protein V5P93_003556 [Actinokineospora auranticolor]|uniref:Uncharacterized protein n=1 Tax=Actinokineospora auranticolor TaxID=155976 RepID=A0A2S6GPT0_9PSEU|nr:hypothetical protein [Actinokineospora auranticolor]PPK67219.1 hypothetical protein CLV40_108217 [Actinokineospora auranticolor]
MKTIAWIVLLIGAACTAMYVATGLGGGPVAWANGWLAGPILLVFVAPTLFSLAGKLGGGFAALRGGVPKQFRGAPIGMGTVISVGRTGLSVNDQPQLAIQLRVDAADGRSFVGTARQIVDLTELGAVQPGAVLPVRYLPDGSVALATDASQPELQAALNRVQLAKGHITPQQLRIAEHGIDASAVVLAMAPTGEIRDGRTVAKVTLRITRPDHTMFDLTQEKALPQSAIPRVQPGSAVQVKYLPHDESEVAIVTSLA